MLQSRIEHSDLRRFIDATERFGAGRELAIEPLAGDVSTRCYYRISRGAERAIAAWYPPDLRDAARRFERTTTLLTRAGVRVPAIFEFDAAAGLMLLEDVGSETLFDWRERSWEELRPYLEAAYDAAERVSAIAPAELADLMPPLDAAVARARAGDDLGRVPPSRRAWSATTRSAAGCAPPSPSCAPRSRPTGWCPATATSWRATWCRSADGAVAVLDHQDLRLGPSAYDAASLVQRQPLSRRKTRSSRSRARSCSQRRLPPRGGAARAQDRGHLRLVRAPRPAAPPAAVPRSLRRALDHLAALPESAALAAELEQRWAPGALLD